MKLRNRQFILLSYKDTTLIFNEAKWVSDMNEKFGLSYYSCMFKDTYKFVIVDVKKFMLACIKYNINVLDHEPKR